MSKAFPGAYVVGVTDVAFCTLSDLKSLWTVDPHQVACWQLLHCSRSTHKPVP